jgi:hypothetical protein
MYNEILFCFFDATGVWTQCLVLLLGRHFTAWPTPPALFAFLILGLEYCTYAWASLNHNLPIYASWVTGMTDLQYYAQLIDWDGVLQTFCQGWPWMSILPIFASWVAGITGVSYHTQTPMRILKNKTLWNSVMKAPSPCFLQNIQ